MLSKAHLAPAGLGVSLIARASFRPSPTHICQIMPECPKIVQHLPQFRCVAQAGGVAHTDSPPGMAEGLESESGQWKVPSVLKCIVREGGLCPSPALPPSRQGSPCPWPHSHWPRVGLVSQRAGSYPQADTHPSRVVGGLRAPSIDLTINGFLGYKIIWSL